MGLRGYLSLIGLGTALAAAAWGIVLFSVNPEEADILAFVMFYVTLAAMLVGMLTMIMTVARVYVLRREVIQREIQKAFRHALLFTAITVVSLFLAAGNRFSIITLVIMIAATSIIEYFFLQFSRRG
jgi:hypothetical protein